jgi:hypothetical protein
MVRERVEPSAQAAEAAKFLFDLRKPGLRASGELDSRSPTLNDDVRSSTCMPP